MTRRHWMIPMVLLTLAAGGVPARAEAASCTDGYQKCLNDSYDTSGFTRVLADVECLAEYVGCVRRKV
ncbi:MAG TPA: hypothetical protein VF188_05730 [Longimicrobiales bacterium]